MSYPGWGQQLQCPSATGKNPTDEYLEGMMNEAPGPINFTMFLTMFGEKLNGTDPEDVIRNAFACFDEEASGQCARETWARWGAQGALCYGLGAHVPSAQDTLLKPPRNQTVPCHFYASFCHRKL